MVVLKKVAKLRAHQPFAHQRCCTEDVNRAVHRGVTLAALVLVYMEHASPSLQPREAL